MAVHFDRPMDISFEQWSAFMIDDGLDDQTGITGGWTSPTELTLICTFDVTDPPPIMLLYTPPVNPSLRLKSAAGLELAGGEYTNLTPA